MSYHLIVLPSLCLLTVVVVSPLTLPLHLVSLEGRPPAGFYSSLSHYYDAPSLRSFQSQVSITLSHDHHLLCCIDRSERRGGRRGEKVEKRNSESLESECGMKRNLYDFGEAKVRIAHKRDYYCIYWVAEGGNSYLRELHHWSTWERVHKSERSREDHEWKHPSTWCSILAPDWRYSRSLVDSPEEKEGVEWSEHSYFQGRWLVSQNA